MKKAMSFLTVSHGLNLNLKSFKMNVCLMDFISSAQSHRYLVTLHLDFNMARLIQRGKKYLYTQLDDVYDHFAVTLLSITT